jgi:DUF4097 and DUF4098 domain-containing protein YvlB
MHSAFRIAGIGAGAFLLLAITGTTLFNHAEFVSRTAPNSQDRTGDRVEEEMFNETFSVQPGEQLLVDVIHSDIHIEKSKGSEAHIRITLEGREINDQTRDFFEYLNFKVGQTDGKLFVRTDPEGNWSWRRKGWRMRAGVHVYISVPEMFDAKMDVAHGDVDIDALKGALNVDLAHGDLDAGSLSGSSLSMDIAHGDVQTSQLGSERIRLNLQHGDLSTHRIDATNVELSTAHGDLDIDYATAKTIRIRTAHGDLAMNHVTAEEIDAEAAHGDIDVHEMDGYPRMEVRHGDISLHFLQAAGGRFSAAHGDIDLSAPALAALDVDFNASDISMDNAFQFEGIRKEKEVQGRVNGGGSELYARASHGEIALQTR